MTADQITASNYDWQIARLVRLAIMDSRLMQKEVALAAGLHPSSMTMSMQGKRPWRAEELVRIALATGVAVTDLLPHLDSNQEPSDYRPAQVTGAQVLRSVESGSLNVQTWVSNVIPFSSRTDRRRAQVS